MNILKKLTEKFGNERTFKSKDIEITKTHPDSNIEGLRITAAFDSGNTEKLTGHAMDYVRGCGEHISLMYLQKQNDYATPGTFYTSKPSPNTEEVRRHRIQTDKLECWTKERAPELDQEISTEHPVYTIKLSKPWTDSLIKQTLYYCPEENESPQDTQRKIYAKLTKDYDNAPMFEDIGTEIVEANKEYEEQQ